MSKKILSALLSLVIFINLLPIIEVKVSANENAIDSQGVKYSVLSDLEVEVSGFTDGISEHITIPETILINGCNYNIVRISDCAFGDCKNVRSVVLSDSIRSVYQYAFYNCENLEMIKIGKSVSKIRSSAFWYCTSLKDIVVDEENRWFKTGEDGVLYNKNQTEIVKCPGGKTETKFELKLSVRSIRPGAFDSCLNLTEINANENSEIFSSDKGVLYNKTQTELIVYPCGKMESSFEISKQIEKIYPRAIANCINLSSINTNKENEYFSSVNGVLYDKYQTELLVYPAGKRDECYTPVPKLQVISSYAFAGCKHLVSFVSPGTINSLEKGIFEGCISLNNIIISNCTEVINDYVFIGCSGLHKLEVEYQSHLVMVKSKAFYCCPKDLKVVVHDCKGKNSNLRKCYLGSYCCNKYGLFGDIKDLEDMFADAFMNEFTAAEVSEKIVTDEPRQIKINADLYEILTDINGNKNAVLFSLGSCKEENVVVPNNVSYEGEIYLVREIGAFAASEHENLRFVDLGDSITKIGDCAFCDCKNLMKVKLPNNLIKIGIGGFSYCCNLNEIELPSSLNQLAVNAFFKCSRLETLVIPDGIREIEKSIIQGCNKLKAINVPSSVIKIDSTEIVQKMFVCPDNKVYSSDDKGVLYNKDKTVLINYPLQDPDRSYDVPSSVTVIGSCAFMKRMHARLRLVRLHKNIIRIEDEAFSTFIDVLIESGSNLNTISQGHNSYYLECVEGSEEYSRLSELIYFAGGSVIQVAVMDGVEYGLGGNSAWICGYRDKSAEKITVQDEIFYNGKVYKIDAIYFEMFWQYPKNFRICLPYEKGSVEDIRLRNLIGDYCEDLMVENGC